MVVPLAAGFCFAPGGDERAGLSAGFFILSAPVAVGFGVGLAGGSDDDKDGSVSVGWGAEAVRLVAGFCAALCVEFRNNRLLPTTQSIAARAPRIGLRLVLGCMVMVFS